MHLWFFLFILLLAVTGGIDKLNEFAGPAFSAGPKISQMFREILTHLPQILGQ